LFRSSNNAELNINNHCNVESFIVKKKSAEYWEKCKEPSEMMLEG